jgi:hypothetical protein
MLTRVAENHRIHEPNFVPLRGGGCHSIPVSRFPALKTFRMNTSAKFACKPPAMNTSKFIGLNPPVESTLPGNAGARPHSVACLALSTDGTTPRQPKGFAP